MVLTSPLFLIGLLAIAIPIAVHLFNFRRYKKIYFSNVDRLEQLQTETRRQSTLRQLLILAARILAIAFLVLAFARPVIPSSGTTLRTGSNDVSIFIDNSFSMENSDGNERLLDKAKSKAREIMAAYGPSDRFQLLTNDMEGHQFHWLSKDEALLKIDEIEVSASALAVSDVARRQFDFLGGGSGNNRYAFLLSDFQSTTSSLADFPVDSNIIVTFVPLEASDVNNIFIDSVALNAPVFHLGNSVTAQVWLRNEGDEDLEKVPVTLSVNNRQRAMATVDIPAQGATVTDMHFIIDEPGSLHCKVSTTDYPITFDDNFFFTINVCSQINALVIEGAADNEFLRRLFDGDSLVHYSSVSLKQMDFSRIDGINMVLLDELPSLSSGMAQTLSHFVEEGGTLVVVLPSDADQNSYNAALRLSGAPQLAGFSKNRVTASSINYDNPLYLNVFSGKNDDMELPTITGYQRLQSDASTNREAIISLSNGDEYISVTKYGSGLLYLITAPLREAHTDFVRQALFVPTLYNMALFSVNPSPVSSTLGQTMPIPLTNTYDASEGQFLLRCVSSDGVQDEIPDLRRSGGKNMLVLHNTLKEAGNYLLQQEGQHSEGLSLNYPREESQMTFLGHDALSKMIKDNNLSNCSVVRNANKPLDTYLHEQMEGHRLWRWCLALSLLMLLIEIYLLRR